MSEGQGKERKGKKRMGKKGKKENKEPKEGKGEIGVEGRASSERAAFVKECITSSCQRLLPLITQRGGEQGSANRCTSASAIPVEHVLLVCTASTHLGSGEHIRPAEGLSPASAISPGGTCATRHCVDVSDINTIVQLNLPNNLKSWSSDCVFWWGFITLEYVAKCEDGNIFCFIYNCKYSFS